MRTINNNIWDDFCEDNNIPAGEIQETYAYVEQSDVDLDEQKYILLAFMKYINHSLGFLPTMDLKLYDSKKIYTNLPDEMHYQRWKIQFEHLTHKMISNLIKKHNALVEDEIFTGLILTTGETVNLNIYSES